MINAIIVDDEPLNLEEITRLVEKSGEVQIAKTYSSPLKALEEIALVSPDLAFIDIEMPEIDGITLVEKLLEWVPALKIVFITAYNQYAVMAFELNALDYILKPINPKRFEKTLCKVKDSLARKVPEEGSLEIKCFGNLEVKTGSERVKWERSKAEELFCYLLTHHGQGMHKEIILEELWPDHDPRKAIPILQTSICRLRNIFAPLREQVRLDYSNNRYSLTITECECDLFQVEDALSGNPDSLETAAQLIGKGFLSGQGYLWAMVKEEELKVRLAKELRARADNYSSCGNVIGAIRELQLLLSILPYDEEANNLMLINYGRLSDVTGIIEHYQWLELIMKKDFGLAPPASTRSLYNELCKKACD